MEKVCFKTKKGPAALGPYSTATIYGGVIYLSGMIGVNPQTGKASEGGTLAQAAQGLLVVALATEVFDSFAGEEHNKENGDNDKRHKR